MAYTEMYLPIDIPWKRMGASEDMIDEEVGDLKFPEKWRSSIAAFYHEPQDLPPEYCNRKITYLKVICTITNFQLPSFQDVGTIREKRLGELEQKDITVLDEMRKKCAAFYAWKDFEAHVTDSYPCYGALVQIGVYPNPAEDEEGNKVKKHDYPYIVNFQPRKREMYEALSESGEVASQSGTRVNVNKGSTTTKSTERYELDMGGTDGINLGFLGTFGIQEENIQKGTVDRNESQSQHVTNRDESRDKRESYSYSTNINQLYSLLQGYHVGTNRALFFMQPRPHIQDTKSTFIRGLRRLEGIQEFFLIVNRPKAVPGFCIEVALETAHTYSERAYRAHFIAESELRDPKNLRKTADALQTDEAELSNMFPQEFALKKVWNVHTPWHRYLAHHYVKEGLFAAVTGQVDSGHLTWDDFGLMRGLALRYPEIGQEKVELIFDEYESDSGHIFITGRQLCSCFLPANATETNNEAEEAGRGGEVSVDIEKSDEDHISTCGVGTSVVVTEPFTLNQAFTPERPMSSATLASNTLVQQLNECLISSIGSAKRLRYGEASFLETEFVLEEMSQMVRLMGKAGLQDHSLNEIEGFKEFIKQGLGKVSKAKTIIDLGGLSTEMIALDLNVSTQKARAVRRDLLIGALRVLDVKTISKEFKPVNPILDRIDSFSKGKTRKREKDFRTPK